jgi:hypothetical protein
MKKLILSALVGLFAVAATSGVAFAQTPAAPAAAPAAADPTAVGDWALSINTPQGIVEMGVALKVSEPGKLGGTAKGELGEFPITGTIDDKGIVFIFTVNYQGSPLTLTFAAATPDDNMTGTVDFGGMAAGDFAAKRVKANGFSK